MGLLNNKEVQRKREEIIKEKEFLSGDYDIHWVESYMELKK